MTAMPASACANGTGNPLPAKETGHAVAVVLPPSFVVLAEEEGGSLGGVEAWTTGRTDDDGCSDGQT